VEKQKELDELFTPVLAALRKEGLITREQGMQDGTKSKAQASVRSYQQEQTIGEHLERARRRVAERDDPGKEESNSRTKQARARGRREQQERLENALPELEQLQNRKHGEKAKSQVGVSSSDPHARVMHPSDGGLALSYHAQIAAAAAHGLMVGVAVTQEANDTGQLLPAVERIAEGLQRKPEQRVADAGYTTGAAIEEMAERKVDFLGHAARRRVHGEERSAAAATQRFHFSARDESLCVSRGQVLAPRKILEEGARASFPPLLGTGGGLSKRCPQTRGLSGKSRRPGDFAFGGERRSSGFPAEDGNGRSTGKLLSAWPGRGILPCLDQKQAGFAPVSRSRAAQSANGDALGLPYLQPATVDPLAQTAAHASHGLDSENRRERKKTESTRAAQAKKPKSSSRHKNQPARDVSS
jgi:hypothetical protein